MELFDCAAVTLAACRAVLRQVTGDDLGRPTPCSEYTVGEVGLHVVRSMVLLASVAGEQVEVPVAGSVAGPVEGSVAGPVEGSVAGLVGSSVEAGVAAAGEAAIAAWRRRGLDGSVAVGRSILPAGLAVEIIPLELLVHGWDVGRATGREIDVPPEVAGYVLDRARELITPDKRGRSFAAEVPAGPEASVLQRLIAFTGRAP